MIFIKNGTVFPMTASPIENGALLIEKNKIAKVGPLADFGDLPADADLRIIDAGGGWILPGLVEAHCHVGITEDKKGMELDGCNEAFSPVTPHLSALDGINPADAAFSDAAAAGITTVMIGPGSSNVVGGLFIAMKTRCTKTPDCVIDDMAILSPAAMKVAFGENPMGTYREQKTLPSTRMAIAAVLREEIFKAVEYKRERDQAEKSGAFFKKSYKYECWLPVLNNEIPLKAHVHRADDIMTAIRIAKEFGLGLTLDHCSEGHLIADRIKKEGFPAIVGPYESFRNKIELENLNYATAAKLAEVGVTIAITTDHPVCVIKSLPLCAGLAVKAGLPLEEGLRAITINAARILRLDYRIGSLSPGKDADIAIYDGNPMETFTKTLYTLIDGKVIFEKDK